MSSISGSGSILSTKSLSAGHSATADRNAHVELNTVGTLVASQSGSDAAIDPVNGASVSVSGSTLAAVSITGDPFGTGTALADALIEAGSHQFTDGYGPGQEVWTEISTELDLHADDGQTATGRATASGRASAGGNMGTIVLSSFAAGNTLSSGSVTGHGGHAGLGTDAGLESWAYGYDDGSWGWSNADIWSEGGTGGTGSGSASMSANGQAGAASTWDDGLGSSGKETSSAAGQTTGAFSFRISEPGGGVGGESYIISNWWDDGADIVGDLHMGAGDDSFAGSATFTASGTAHTVHTDTDMPMSSDDCYSSGRVSGTITQAGAGHSSGSISLESDPWLEPFSVSFPIATDPGSIYYGEVQVSPSEDYGVSSMIGGGVDINSDSDAFRSTANLLGSGTVITSGQTNALGIDGTTNAVAKGTVSTSSSSRGVTEIDAGSGLAAEALLGDGSTQEVDITGTLDGDPPFIAYVEYPSAATVSMIGGGIGSHSASSTVAISANGNAGATATNEDVGNPYLLTTDAVSSSSTAAGIVTGNVRTTTADGYTETDSAIWGMSAAMGTEDFGITDSGILSASAVVNPEAGTMTAGGRASGNARSGVSETGIEYGTDLSGNPLTNQLTLSSSDSGSVTSDILVNDGFGNSLAYVRSGNQGGFFGPIVFGIESTTPGELFTGIHTESMGEGNDPGSRVSGSSSVTSGVSDDSGSYVQDVFNPITGETHRVFTVATSNHLADPARSEFTVRDDYYAEAETDAWAYSEAFYLPLTLTGQSDAWGGFEVYAQGDQGAPGTTARATVRPVNLNAATTAVAGIPTLADYTSVRMNGGSGSAYVKTQPPNVVTASESASMISPAADGVGQAVDAGTDTDAIGNPNYADAWISLAASNWIPAPVPFRP